MNQKHDFIETALKQNRTILSEYESKKFLSAYGIPVTREHLVHDPQEFMTAVRRIGYPLVIKGCSSTLAHKTEKGLIRVDIRSDQEANAAFEDMMSRMEESDKAILVQEMVKGSRELVVGLTRDSQFGPCVMFGLGGIFTEVLKDISFRVAPIEKRDALEMAREIKAHKILDGIRGMPPVDMDKLCAILITMGDIGMENDEIKEIDVNPLIISGAMPVAVDALVVLNPHP